MKGKFNLSLANTHTHKTLQITAPKRCIMNGWLPRTCDSVHRHYHTVAPLLVWGFIKADLKIKTTPERSTGGLSPLRLLKGLKRGRERTPWSIRPDIPSDLESRNGVREGGSFKEQPSNNRWYLRSDSHHKESPLALASTCASHYRHGRDW